MVLSFVRYYHGAVLCEIQYPCVDQNKPRKGKHQYCKVFIFHFCLPSYSLLYLTTLRKKVQSISVISFFIKYLM